MPEKEQLCLQMSKLWVVIRICGVTSLVCPVILYHHLAKNKEREVTNTLYKVLSEVCTTIEFDKIGQAFKLLFCLVIGLL